MTDKDQITIVMYHYVRNLKMTRYPNIKGLQLSLFREQIDFFKSKYCIIDCEQLLDSIDRKLSLPQNSLLLTFDDGYLDHYTNVFPILKEKRIQGCFSVPAGILAEKKLLDVNKIHFILAATSIEKLMKSLFKRLDYYREIGYVIPSNEKLYQDLLQTYKADSRFDGKEIIFIKRLLQVELEEDLRKKIVEDLFGEFIFLSEEAFVKELYMSYDQIKLMKKSGMYFAIHGYNHDWLNKLSLKKMQQEIDLSLNFFSEIIDEKKWLMCYPYGAYNEDILEYIASKGCKAGFTTKVGFANKSESPFLLQRFDTNDFPPKSKQYLNY